MRLPVGLLAWMAWGQYGVPLRVVKAAEEKDDKAYKDATAEIPDAELALILTKHGRIPQFDALAADDEVCDAATDDAENEVRQPHADPDLDFADGIPLPGGALPARVPLGPGQMRVPYDTKAPPQTRYACPGNHRSNKKCQCDDVQLSRPDPIREVRPPPRFGCVPACPWHSPNGGAALLRAHADETWRVCRAEA